jgi:hypothetical protein
MPTTYKFAVSVARALAPSTVAIFHVDYRFTLVFVINLKKLHQCLTQYVSLKRAFCFQNQYRKFHTTGTRIVEIKTQITFREGRTSKEERDFLYFCTTNWKSVYEDFQCVQSSIQKSLAFNKNVKELNLQIADLGKLILILSSPILNFRVILNHFNIITTIAFST